MLEFLSSVTWAGVVGYGLWRFAHVAEMVGMAFVERLADFKPSHDPLVPAPPPRVPDDLSSLAFAENEVWAREEVLRAIREKYEEYDDWQKVRVAFGLARMPE